MNQDDKLKWYYPRSLEELPALLDKPGVLPHGGGTSLLRGNLSRIEGLIDLSALPLRFVEHDDREFRIGATTSYSDVVRHMSRIDPNHILVKSLSQAASTPLRNRISIGGSAAFFPPWSDLMGPIIALGARVAIIGHEQGVYDIESYIESRKPRSGNLITEITIPRLAWKCWYHRETRTGFDYPAFTLSLLIADSNGQAERDRELRIVIVGNTGRYSRLTQLEQAIGLASWSEIKNAGLSQHIDVKFAGKRLGSSDYIRHLAEVALQRGLDSIMERG